MTVFKDCMACKNKYRHTAEEWALHHPLVGHGYLREIGWTSEGARLAHEAELAAAPEVK